MRYLNAMKIKDLIKAIVSLPQRLRAIEERLHILEQPRITLNPPQTITWPKNEFKIAGDPCVMGGEHEYPSAWWGINPAPCTKCGQVTASDATIIYTTNDTSIVN